MDLSKSIDFLLEKSGDVIKYRLHKEILHDLSKTEEENLLEKVMLTQNYKLLESYQKANGYIGIGMHSGDKYKETPLQGGEEAARLISNYAIPKDTPLVVNFAKALQDENILEDEFSYANSEIKRFQNRFIGTESGSSLKLLIDTCLALMGFGDDNIIEDTKKISYDTFMKITKIESIDEITKFNPKSKKKYNYPYIEPNTYYPCVYHLQILSYTNSWKNEQSKKALADALNHLNNITKGYSIHVKIGNNYYCPLWPLIDPIRPYETNRIDTMYRRKLTDIVKMGIGKNVDVVNISVMNLLSDLEKDGILRIDFENAYHKRFYKQGQRYPSAYSEVSLEPDYKSDLCLWCDLTFWAVQFLYLYGG